MRNKVSTYSKEHHTFHCAQIYIYIYIDSLEQQVIHYEHQLQEDQAVEPVTVSPPTKSVKSRIRPIYTSM